MVTTLYDKTLKKEHNNLLTGVYGKKLFTSAVKINENKYFCYIHFFFPEKELWGSEKFCLAALMRFLRKVRRRNLGRRVFAKCSGDRVISAI